MRPGVYTTTWSRALLKYVNNGFFARRLDADDITFLEQVRERGIANRELPNTNYFLIEELDYWHFPYAVDHTIERRVGPPTPAVIVAEAEALRRREQRIYDRKLLKAARTAAQKDWEQHQTDLAHEREERLRKTMEADLEWDRDHPREASNLHDDNESFAPYDDVQHARRRRPPSKKRQGPISPRHYVPCWQEEEWEEAARADGKKAKQKARHLEAQEERTWKAKHVRTWKEKQEAKRERAWAEAEAEREEAEVQEAMTQAEDLERTAIAETEQQIMQDTRRSDEIDDILREVTP